MSLVSNTGPLIALAKADQLRLLQALYTRVTIGPVVQRELLAKSGLEAGRLDLALSTFIEVAAPPDLSAEGRLAEVRLAEVRLAAANLDAGEREAVALAWLKGHRLIIDDRLGRQAARRLGVVVTGTGGVLVLAKQQGLIPAVRPLLEQIRRQGYWLSDEGVALVSRLAGE